MTAFDYEIDEWSKPEMFSFLADGAKEIVNDIVNDF